MNQFDQFTEWLNELSENPNYMEKLIYLATVHQTDAEYVRRFSEKLINNVYMRDPKQVLTAFQAINNIIKSTGEPYTSLLSKDIVKAFVNFVKKIKDSDIMHKLVEIRREWNDIFPKDVLSILDYELHKSDSKWPGIGIDCIKKITKTKNHNKKENKKKMSKGKNSLKRKLTPASKVSSPLPKTCKSANAITHPSIFNSLDKNNASLETCALPNTQLRPPSRNMQMPPTNMRMPHNVPNQYNRQMRPNMQMHPNMQMRPNMQMHPNMQMQPNMGMPPNMQMQPNMGMPPNMQMQPNMGMPPNMQMQPNMGMPPNMQMQPNMGMPPNMHMQPNMGMPPNMQMQPNMRMPPNMQMQPNMRMPPNMQSQYNRQMHPNMQMQPNMRMPLNMQRPQNMQRPPNMNIPLQSMQMPSNFQCPPSNMRMSSNMQIPQNAIRPPQNMRDPSPYLNRPPPNTEMQPNSQFPQQRLPLITPQPHQFGMPITRPVASNTQMRQSIPRHPNTQLHPNMQMEINSQVDWNTKNNQIRPSVKRSIHDNSVYSQRQEGTPVQESLEKCQKVLRSRTASPKIDIYKEIGSKSYFQSHIKDESDQSDIPIEIDEYDPADYVDLIPNNMIYEPSSISDDLPVLDEFDLKNYSFSKFAVFNNYTARKLYEGTPCSICYRRFRINEQREFQSHLDFHFVKSQTFRLVRRYAWDYTKWTENMFAKRSCKIPPTREVVRTLHPFEDYEKNE